MTPDPKGCFNYGRRMSRSSGDLVQCGCDQCLTELEDRENFGKRRGPFDGPTHRDHGSGDDLPHTLKSAIEEILERDVH